MHPRTLLLLAPVLLSACAGMITGGPLVTDPKGPTAQVAVHNRTGRTIDVVLLSRCRASTYGLNRLPRGESIAPGETYAFTVTPGCWDVAAGVVGYGETRQRFPTVVANARSTFTVTGGR